MAESDSKLPVPLPQRHGLWGSAQSQYKGLVEACAPGMHAGAMELLMSYVKPKGPVLDLGAGSGAWLARVNDAGFRDLNAVELNVAWFGFDGVVPRPIDLNIPFSTEFDSTFQLITALEILEHLDCPRSFLREIHRLLGEEGYALISMPNIGHWAGRVRFLFRAEHRYFEERDYEQRHISPVTDLQMRLMFRELGFRLVDSTTAGSFDGPLKRLVYSPIALFFRVLLGVRVSGDVSIYLVVKDQPDSASLGSDSHYNSRLSQALTRHVQDA